MVRAGPRRSFVLRLVVLVGIGVLTVRTSDVHPVPSRLIYAIDADSWGSHGALPVDASAARTNAWTRTALAPFAHGPESIAHFFEGPVSRLSPSACPFFCAAVAINILWGFDDK